MCNKNKNLSEKKGIREVDLLKSEIIKNTLLTGFATAIITREYKPRDTNKDVS